MVKRTFVAKRTAVFLHSFIRNTHFDANKSIFRALYLLKVAMSIVVSFQMVNGRSLWLFLVSEIGNGATYVYTSLNMWIKSSYVTKEPMHEYMFVAFYDSRPFLVKLWLAPFSGFTRRTSFR